MNTPFRTLLAAAAIVASSSGVCAEVYGSLNTPPGVYFGSGNPNGNFNITRDGGLELGLRAKNRSTIGPVLIDGSSGVYSVPGGPCGPTCGGAGQRAKWNYEFSMHTVGGAQLSDYTFVLGIDHDPSAGTNFTFVDPLAKWADEKYDGPFGVQTSSVGAFGAQNSQNVSFADTPGGAFNVSAPGLYDFVLFAYRTNDLDKIVLASVDITVQVPEPASLALFGLGLLSLAGLRRRTSK
jgi:hypothetical protein